MVTSHSLDALPPSEARSEIIIPDRRGVGTLAQQFEKSARIALVSNSPPKPPPKPLYARDDHRERLRQIDNEILSSQGQQYDYDYSGVDRMRYAKRSVSSDGLLECYHEQKQPQQIHHQQRHAQSGIYVKDDGHVPIHYQTPTHHESLHQDEPIYDLPPPVAPEVPQHRRPASSAPHPPAAEKAATRANSATQTNESKQIQTDSYDDYQSQETLSFGSFIFLKDSSVYIWLVTCLNKPVSSISRVKTKPPVAAKPKKIPPRPKQYLGVDRSDSGGNWSAAGSDFQYTTPTQSSIAVNQSQHFNHDYENQTNSIARPVNDSPKVLHDSTHAKNTKSHPTESSLNTAVPQHGKESSSLTTQDGGGRLFKFVVSGPKHQKQGEHARFSAPFVKSTSNGIRVSPQVPVQPVPNPRRSTGGNMGTTGSTGSSEANKMIYSENKPTKPQPRVRRKSAGDLIEAAPRPSSNTKGAVTKTWNPPKPDPKKAPLITSKFNPSDIKRYSPTPIAETEPVHSSPKGKTYQQQLDEFREHSPRSSGKTKKTVHHQQNPTKQEKATKYESEPDTRARRMRDKAKRQRSAERLILEENPGRSRHSKHYRSDRKSKYEPSIASSYMPGYSQSHYKEALRSGMAVQMVKTKPRGWVGDARRRHHSPTTDEHGPASAYGSTSDWVQDQTRYRVNNPHGGKGGRPIQHQPIGRSHGPHPGFMGPGPRGPYPPRPMGPPHGPNPYPPKNLNTSCKRPVTLDLVEPSVRTPKSRDDGATNKSKKRISCVL
ncbi:Oidioi.mRNA.OKI2018_I69.XSR.g15406.t3.cds [Oikopleura dioica]|uniref:Oidioi.mRNA.OKI2018_I69.XSR.g15406.t3.cds n=1 Tax=Oikopleura dioica TaxID=34765 RepID=A0ABN7SDB5_OIKDI|nr:Oidioi.mRNA.OKI2018_I69.XSR.g15406.t3.cds [Oikopleura dioica]